jgi:hypothetical protein
MSMLMQSHYTVIDFNAKCTSRSRRRRKEEEEV